jgi:hypothetical protein
MQKSLFRASGHLIIEGCENNRYHWDFTAIIMDIFDAIGCVYDKIVN